MDPNDEIERQFLHLIRIYKSGRVERLEGTDIVPASVDPLTEVSSKDLAISPDTGVSARLYLPSLAGNPEKKLPVLVYYHGGGFCVQNAFSPLYQPFLNTLASRARVIIVSVDYRLAPEHPLPAAYDDSWVALQWVVSHAKGGGLEPWLAEHADFEHVFVAGDSAGGNIAYNMAMRSAVCQSETQMELKIERMALMSPFFWASEPVGSESTIPWLAMMLEEFWKFLFPSTTGMDDPVLNPFSDDAPALDRLPCDRVLVCVAEMEYIKDRLRVYCERLKESGYKGEVELLVSEGEDHVFHLYKPDSEKALELMDKLVAFFLL